MGSVVIPVHDENPVRRTPWVTYALVAANVVVFLLTPVSLGTVASRAGRAVPAGGVLRPVRRDPA